MNTVFYIGTSGWHYNHWRQRFYPQDMPKSKWLEFYTQSFNTVELNNSFYHLPTRKAFENWRDTVSDNFMFSVKVSRLITHLKKLRNIDEQLSNFLGRADLLDNKLGPLLYQLPPHLKSNTELLETFISYLPKTKKHVFEFRHKTWFNDAVYNILQRYNIGFCIYDMPNLVTPILVTADFAYIRFHGSSTLYGSCYSTNELAGWAETIIKLSDKLKDIYVYFNNDSNGFAVQNAIALTNILKG